MALLSESRDVGREDENGIAKSLQQHYMEDWTFAGERQECAVVAGSLLGGDEGTTLNIVMCDYHLLYEGVILVAKKMRIKFQKTSRGGEEKMKSRKIYL